MTVERIFRDERGFTTAAMALSILIALALVFTGAQVYRINSAAAEVQEVADAAVLSAENQVGEFMVIAQFCDAVVLSLSLTSLTAAGLGLAAMCTPVTAGLSQGLVTFAKDTAATRDRFSQKAAQVLNRLQEALPFFAAACAASVAFCNNDRSSGSNYLAAAILVPSKGQEIKMPSNDEANRLLDDIEGGSEEIRRKAAEAEEAAKEANAAKERAFLSDCGDNPGRCMYERAAHLAGLEGGDNPLYSSVDTWSFSVALQRARTYYRHRLDHESPEGSSVEAQSQSALRRDFYRYAVQQMQGAYVHEGGDGFEAYFPHLPRNTAQMRQTSLYLDPIYPITYVEGSSEGEGSDEGAGEGTRHGVMHAWSGCPGAADAAEKGSIAQMESGDFQTCEICGFKAASLGKVAAASTSIDSGFEYHYEIVAEQAAIYQQAAARAQGPKDEVKDSVGSLLERVKELSGVAGQCRIDARPPGRNGAIAFVVNAGSYLSSGGFGSRFVGFSGDLGPRAAVSGATLLKDGAAEDEGRTVLNAMLDGLRRDGGAAVGAAGLVLDAWSFLLKAYTDGQQALTDGIRTSLDSLPLVGASGLGTWASDRLKGVIDELHLQPAELKPRKAILVNSGLVAAEADGGVAKGYSIVRQRLIAGSQEATDLFSLILNDVEQEVLDRVEGMIPDKIELASIELLGPDGPSIPLVIPMPDEVKDFGTSAVHDIFDRLRSFHGQEGGPQPWV